MDNKEFVKMHMALECTSDNLLLIHDRIKAFGDTDRISECNSLLEAFFEADADINRLKTLLVITKAFRDHELISANRKKVLALYESKKHCPKSEPPVPSEPITLSNEEHDTYIKES